KPTLDWRIAADRAAKLDAELSYLSGGMSWHADYNIVSPETGDKLDIVAWVTVDNQSGKAFENARIKLVAGDVSKLAPQFERLQQFAAMGGAGSADAPGVTERSFDEYHTYTLERPTTLRDSETKQVEFLRASGVDSKRFYVYDGAQLNQQRYQGWNTEMIRDQPEYGIQSNRKV